MSAGKSRGAKCVGGVLVGALCLVMAQTEAYSAQNTQPSQTIATRQAPFTLTIENNLISLTARDASIKAILEELGRRMNIAVVAEYFAHSSTITNERSLVNDFVHPKFSGIGGFSAESLING